MTKAKRTDELEQQNAELIADLQRIRADFENHRKRSELDKVAAKLSGEQASITKLLPVIDTIERAIVMVPEDIKDHAWVKGVQGLSKNLTSSLQALGLSRIDAAPGTVFNPELHQALQFEDEAEGDEEVIKDELQAGYMYKDAVLRHSLVNVTRK